MSLLADTPEDIDFQKSLNSLANRKFAYIDETANDGSEKTTFREILGEVAGAGLAGIAIPSAQGGQGGTLAQALIALDALTHVSVRAGDAIQALNFGAIRQLAQMGTAKVREEWLKPALVGERLLGVAMSEPDVGSDLTNMRTKAARRDGEVVLTGEKVFSTHGVESDAVVVWCRFGPTKSELGAVLVPTDAPGFERGRAERFMSGEPYCVMSMRECAVPERYVLADSDLFELLFPVFNIERLGNAGRCLSAAQRAFEIARDYAATREIAGGPLSQQQGIRWKFAEMRMELDACHLLLAQAARAVDENGFPSAGETAIAKAYINQKSFSVVNEALQVMGAAGYSCEYPVEYIFRRIRGWMIAGGTVEVLKNRIARDVFRSIKQSA